MDELWKAIIPWFLRVFGTAIGIGIAFMFIKSATLPSQLTGTVKRGWSKARKNYKESAPGQYRARIKANAQRAVETGNFSGTAKNPLNWTKLGGSRINRGLNRSRFYNAATRGYGAARSLDIRNQNLEAQKKSQDEFGGDYELEEAWIQDGGVAGSHYSGLNEGQKKIYDQMVRDGRGKNANSFIAAMRGVAQSGRGNQ
ncbi:MAG TPA: hypothetical protein VNX65_02750, partial [Patescibacteria group bacterium]|nr:hypothetical protein [Patescibacteria group bacterium]